MLRHPDSHELNDWALYGPKDGKIFELVIQLARDHGMRERDIERIIEKALEDKLKKLQDSGPT
jgi:hypothetical protein